MKYLFNHPWGHEVSSFEAGLVPEHRFYGMFGLRERGHRVTFLTLPPKAQRWMDPSRWKVVQAVWAIRGADAVIAAHEAAALPLLLFKALRLTRVPIVVMSVALVRPENLGGRRNRLLRVLLARAERVLVYATDQVDGVASAFGISTVAFCPLGVDTSFFAPGPADGQGAAGASVGSNEGKDFLTLVEALRTLDLPWLVVTDPRNAALIEAADPPDGLQVRVAVPIDALRDVYRAAPVTVIPLHPATFSSGQTVMLELLSLGRPLVITDAPSIRDYVRDGVEATLVPAGDAKALAEAIRAAWTGPASNPAGRARALAEFSVARQAERLEEFLSEVTRRPLGCTR